MSAPHWLVYDVIINNDVVEKLDLDVDLDNPIEVFEEINKAINKSNIWEYRLLFRFSEHLFSSTKKDFVLEDFFYKGNHETLTLRLSRCVDFG